MKENDQFKLSVTKVMERNATEGFDLNQWLTRLSLRCKRVICNALKLVCNALKRKCLS